MPNALRRIAPALALSALLALLFAPAAAAGPVGFEFTLSPGYRVDYFDFTIAGNPAGTNPNIRSELVWDNLVIAEANATARLLLPWNLVVRADGGYGAILAGDNRDSDYNRDDRQGEFMRSLSDAGDGYVWQASVGAGYRFSLLAGSLEITPLAGYAHHEQHLVIQGGQLTIPSYTPLPNLDSEYNTEWRSGWLGADVRYEWRRFTFSGTAEMHRAWFEAWGNWNLRKDLAHPKSLGDEADAWGWNGSVSARYRLTDYLSVGVFTRGRVWLTDDGRAYSYKADGTVWVTRLNRARWSSVSGGAEVSVRF